MKIGSGKRKTVTWVATVDTKVKGIVLLCGDHNALAIDQIVLDGKVVFKGTLDASLLPNVTPRSGDELVQKLLSVSIKANRWDKISISVRNLSYRDIEAGVLLKHNGLLKFAS